MNEYANYVTLKRYMGITETGDDSLIQDICTQASRIWDRLCRERFFYEKLATWYYDYADNYQLFLNADLLSLTTLTNGNGDAIPATDYFLYPLNDYPKTWIEIDKGSGNYFTYETTKQRALSVAALWGYHADYDNAWADSGDTVEDNPLTAAATSLTVNNGVRNFTVQQMLKVGSEQIYVAKWQDTGDTVQDNPLTAAATTLNVSDGTLFKAGQTVKIDAEEIYVSSISANALTVIRARGGTYGASHANGTAIYTSDVTGNSLTVTRGRNGTTAAQHAQDAAISIWEPDPDVVHWVRRIAAWLYTQKDSQVFGTTGYPEIGVVEVPADLPVDIKRAALDFRRRRF